MARKTRDARLETRTARAKLPVTHEPYWQMIRRGLYLGYRKGPRGAAWWVRVHLGGTRYHKDTLGLVDDHQDANGLDVLDHTQAQERARAFADARARQGAHVVAPRMVAAAAADYLAWYRVNRKDYSGASGVIRTFILPVFGERELNSLTAAEISHWHQSIAESPARRRGGKTMRSNPRARKVRANRILTYFKAMLNRAFQQGHVADDTAWRRVRPFRNVEAPRVRFLTTDEASRLLNACEADFRALAMGALQTGCRYGELTRLRVRDVGIAHNSIHVAESKGGRPRDVPLTDEGCQFFRRAILDKRRDDHVFVRADGAPWGKSDQHRRIRDACTAARIEPPIGFHILRHTYASILVQAGVPLAFIAQALGHADTRVTERHYGHLSPSHVANAIRKHLPSFGIEVDNVAPLKSVK